MFVCVCVFVFVLSWFKWKSPIILQNLILEDMKRGRLSVKLTVLALINICFEACLPQTHFYSIHIIINHMPIAKELPQGQVK